MKIDINSSKSNKLFIIGVVVIIIVAITFFALKYFTIKKDNYKIELIGNKYIVLNINETYNELGYRAYDGNNNEVTNYVKVVNEIKEHVPGIYRIYYQIDNIVEYRIVEIKELVDGELNILFETNINKLTSDNVIINITIVGDAFSSLILPDGSITNKNYVSFIAKENGIYVFEAINDKNESYKKEISINNIDKEAPSGTCTATLLANSTNVKVDVNEDNITYNYYDGNKLISTNNSNNYTFNYKTTNNINVVLEDEVYNSNKINCEIIDNRYHEQVKPSSNEKIVYHGESDTLKTYIVNRNSYYLTYIWIKDAYTQLNKYDSPQYGKNLYVPKVLLEKANTEYNLNNKIMIGFNASGFYLRDTFDADSVRKYSAYDRTSVGTLVITNGKVVRNAYNYAVKTWYTIGVNKENKLLVFEDIKTSNKEEKKAWSESVISSGIRNTFTFAAPLIENGQRTNITTSMPGGYTDKNGLQLLCQINENNFILFTSKNETRNNAITEFTKLGCKTAMNLDGGGSVALFYKDKNSNEIKTVIGGVRQLPEVGYFTE